LSKRMRPSTWLATLRLNGLWSSCVIGLRGLEQLPAEDVLKMIVDLEQGSRRG
jgi:hypothetical protein